jgi:hypothetical protein
MSNAILALVENVWTKHYVIQPPNSTLGDLHMIQIIEWANLTRNSPKWSSSEKQWWFRNFLPKIPLGMVENFPFHLFKPLGWLFLMVIPALCTGLTILQGR